MYACINSATNVSTSCKSLLTIGPVTSAENSLKVKIMMRLGRNYDDRRSFDMLQFENGLEYHNSDFSTLISKSYLSTV